MNSFSYDISWSHKKSVCPNQNQSMCRHHPYDSSTSSSGGNSDEDCPYNSVNASFSPAVLKYISDVLFEEEMESNTCMLQDCIALQAAEKSFYDVLGQKYPPSPQQALPSVDENHEKPNDYITCYSRGRKNHQREDGEDLEEGRTYKHSAQENFDEESVGEGGNNESTCPLYDASRKEAYRKALYDKQLEESIKSRSIRLKKLIKQRELVDLWSLLTQCAQAVASMDQRTANELLQQIRQHSSPFGDGTERLAHYFANGLEARLAGPGTPLYMHIFTNQTSATDILRAYRAFVTACPFKKVSNTFANRNIGNVAENSKRLHIIDFGIGYGFQWPCLISRLSTRPGGSPRIRITGIDLPQPGLRPAARVEQTGRRLKRHAERCNAQFEYSSIAQKWETIRIEDIEMDRDHEVTVVNCMYRLRNIPDDTLMVNSPRDAVLKLIKKINPDLFVHGVVNGTFNAPFFLTRFREAFFHFSALFDILEANIPREDQERLLYEREIFGRDAMNVIACEGTDRFERPETYKQWQARNQRAGFRQVPLDQGVLKRVRRFVKSDYHKNFHIDEDGHWLLQGWKGRVIHAISCWKPVPE